MQALGTAVLAGACITKVPQVSLCVAVASPHVLLAGPIGAGGGISCGCLTCVGTIQSKSLLLGSADLQIRVILKNRSAVGLSGMKDP